MLRNQGELSFEDKWPDMQPVVLKLIRQENVSRDEWQGLFWLVHNVCMWDEQGPQKVRQALQEDVQLFIGDAQRLVLLHQDDSALLKAYISEWRKFFAQCEYLPKPFRHLETSESRSVGQSSSTRPQEESLVRKLMLDSWNDNIFKTINGRLLDSAMKLVRDERNGEAFDTQLVIGVRESYVNLCSDSEDPLKIYRENFESAYISATDAFYRARAQEYLDQNGVQNYMRFAEAKLREEEVRAMRYLETRKGANSVQALSACCVRALVTNFKENILLECPGMIRANETEKLQLMFYLMDRVPDGVDPMLEMLQDFIRTAGLDDMRAAQSTITTDPEKYVEQLLELFNKFSALVKNAFGDDPRFLTARDKAYSDVVNDVSVFKMDFPMRGKAGVSRTAPESKCPELLANYCDLLLRKSALSRKLLPDEVEGKLRNVLLVLKYIKNRDVFMRYHKTQLTRRLVLNTSADSEKEENMVEWLREVGMPAEYVNKLARMFQDIKVSEDLNQEFKNATKNNNENLADVVNIKILNSGAWSRSSERVPVTLPLELEEYIPQVEEFYKQKHNGRKLTWHHMLSNGVIQYKSDEGSYDLEVTTFQMAVLFSWNRRPRERISLESLRLATELPDSELRRTLHSLTAFPKLKQQVLLTDTPVSNFKEYPNHALFWTNRKFVIVKSGRPQKRGKLNLVGRLQLTTDKTQEEDNDSIVQLRILRVQEAIVKIMKMRKELTNAQLQTELVEILKNMFQPTKKMIKEQMEWLIEQNYMKRDDRNINKFYYQA